MLLITQKILERFVNSSIKKVCKDDLKCEEKVGELVKPLRKMKAEFLFCTRIADRKTDFFSQ